MSSTVEKVKSVRELVKLLLFSSPAQALPEHTRELLSILLWKLTEADGKWKTRYRTRSALQCSDPQQLRHEHVYQRAKMVTALLNAKPEEVDGILDSAVGCIVTVEEHRRLAEFDTEYGWIRYSSANIEVVDTLSMQVVALEIESVSTSISEDEKG